MKRIQWQMCQTVSCTDPPAAPPEKYVIALFVTYLHLQHTHTDGWQVPSVQRRIMHNGAIRTLIKAS